MDDVADFVMEYIISDVRYQYISRTDSLLIVRLR